MDIFVTYSGQLWHTALSKLCAERKSYPYKEDLAFSSLVSSL